MALTRELDFSYESMDDSSYVNVVFENEKKLSSTARRQTQVITLLTNEYRQGNLAIDLANSKTNELTFYCITEPTISFENYADTLLKRFNSDASELIQALIHIARFVESTEFNSSHENPGYTKELRINPFTIHRLFVTALVITIKLFRDETYLFDELSIAACVPKINLREMEVTFLNTISYDTFITEEEYQLTLSKLDAVVPIDPVPFYKLKEAMGEAYDAMPQVLWAIVNEYAVIPLLGISKVLKLNFRNTDQAIINLIDSYTQPSLSELGQHWRLFKPVPEQFFKVLPKQSTMKKSITGAHVV